MTTGDPPRERLVAAIRELPDVLAVALQLVLVEGCTTKEAAAILGITAQTFRRVCADALEAAERAADSHRWRHQWH